MVDKVSLPLSLVTMLGCLCIASSDALGNMERQAVVQVETECRNENTGGKVYPQGSGVVFHKEGYVLTAAHVVTCEIEKADVGLGSETDHYERQSVKIRLGSHRGAQLDADVRNVAILEDVAVLKIVGVPAEYVHRTACRRAPLETETPFMGYGFPEGREYAPVPGYIGGETKEGNYAVTANFAGGMSGGPVVVDENIVALILGGAGEVAARRQIIPLFRAGSSIEDATGRRFPFCDDVDKFSLVLSVFFKESIAESRVKTSQRYGVSTTDVIEKCEDFTVSATRGWTIDPETIRIVERIVQGSSRASIFSTSDTQVVVRFCARSTGNPMLPVADSFGAVEFTEKKVNSYEKPVTIEAESDEGEIRVQLPDNTLRWSGELLSAESNRSVSISEYGTYDGYRVGSAGPSSLVIQSLEYADK